jgi:hypothetical protein
MRKIWKWMFGIQGKQLDTPVVIHSITRGECDEKGFADIYINGEKTNVKMLFWTKEEIERFLIIEDEKYKVNCSIYV